MKILGQPLCTKGDCHITLGKALSIHSKSAVETLAECCCLCWRLYGSCQISRLVFDVSCILLSLIGLTDWGLFTRCLPHAKGHCSNVITVVADMNFLINNSVCSTVFSSPYFDKRGLTNVHINERWQAVNIMRQLLARGYMMCPDESMENRSLSVCWTADKNS